MVDKSPEYYTTSGGGISATHPTLRLCEVKIAPSLSGEFNTIKASLVPRACWRLDNLRFAFDSSFLLPDAKDELSNLAVLVNAHPDAPLTVFGHADPVGNDSYNKKLSGRRAQTVYAVLIRDINMWEQLYSNPEGSDNWQDRSIITILNTLMYGPIPEGNKLDDHGREILKKFQKDHGLMESGNPCSSTRQKLFKLYMDHICRDEYNKKPFMLDKKDFLGQGSDPHGKADYQGCSEFNPRLLFSISENQRYQQDSDKSERNRENASNRRVLIYLFQPGVKIAVEHWPCPRAKDGIGDCQKRFWSDHQKRRSLQKDRREYETSHDTFACRFYDRLASQSPCERGEIVAMECLPTLFTIEQPGASNYVRMHSLWAYVAHFVPGSDQLDRVQRYTIEEGKLHDPGNNEILVMECDREAYFYFSHRGDLLSLDQGKWFKKDKSGLPLLGPLSAPRGPDGKLELNIWDQNDWAIVRGPRVDGVRPDAVTMSEWKDNYKIGKLLPLKKGGFGFFPYGSYREKERQEQWLGNIPDSSELVHLGNPGGNAMWAGTLSALPSDKAKLHLIHYGPYGDLHVGSYNEIAPSGKNHDFPGHHLYNQALVDLLLALPSSDQPDSAIDTLPAPPVRCLLPGDICYQSQGLTNNCGAYSFSFVMNYWMPYTNNPSRKDGALYAKPGNVDDTINGARTPADIVNAAHKFKMNARDNDAEELSRPRAIKLLKLWIQAGVPVMVLVEEEYNVWSLHWKTIVGYDGNRFFFNNSGGDAEVIRAQRTPGVNYEFAPVGNDVDSQTAHWNKWKSAGGDIVDLITSVDECTFIPIYPKDSMFSGDSAL
ncbi:OmpA family protein [Desulfosarcina ovata]|uniref:OmpA-like domain-containing protein n=2 Tax=Desulfosarcina ovata TaxID=83564 RepID=A0A5K8A8J8_9BACT|nr:OmpA family protein [Desulfosarcina ovata]BBO81499.1 hypothetical protein DSCO28_20650 [Desulfosarcina ovata subsp. sediminis]BBO88758.1 hypothetical protein DSCOOX_19380 [Desulfosarcina ovata subsp. ovata]